MPIEHTARRMYGVGLMSMGARVAGTGLSFLFTLLLARSMAADTFASLSVALAWLALASAAFSLGMPLVYVRFVGEYRTSGRPDLARGVLSWGVAWTLGVSMAGAGLVALVVGVTGLVPAHLTRDIALTGSALIVPNVMLLVLCGCLQALGKPLLAESISSLTRSALLVAGVGALMALPPHAAPNPVTVLGLQGVTTTLLLALCAGLIWWSLPASLRHSRSARLPGTWARPIPGLVGLLALTCAAERLDLILLGWLAPSAEVASYAIAQRFFMVMTLAANALGTQLGPVLAAELPAIRRGHSFQAHAAIRANGRMTFYAMGAAFLGLLTAGPWLIGWFGPGYASAYKPLLILAAGQWLASLFGPAMLTATLCDRIGWTISGLATGLVVNCALNVLLAASIGSVGAAVASAVGNVIAAAFVRGRLRREIGIETILAVSANTPARNSAAGANRDESR